MIEFLQEHPLDPLIAAALVSLLVSLFIWLRRPRGGFVESPKCPHGVYFYKHCRDCDRADFPEEDEPVDVDEDQELEDDVDEEDLVDLPGKVAIPVIASAASYFGGPVIGQAIAAAAARPRPLRVAIPPHSPGADVSLEINTSAAWSGCCTEFAVLTDKQFLSYIGNVPASANCWRESLSQRYGWGVRAIIIPDDPGLTRVRIRIDGCIVIDATPSMLRTIEARQ